MVRKLAIVFASLAIGLGGWCFAQTTLEGTVDSPDERLDFQPEPKQAEATLNYGGIALKDAVAEFNKRAGQSAIGAEQPPLTEDEVVAAIRNWDLEHYKIDKEMHAIFTAIAAKKMMPKTATLDFISQFNTERFHFDVWQIALEIRDGEKGYRYPIRQHMLKSRTLDGSDDKLEVKKK